MQRQRSLSPVLQVIHALLVTLPEFRALDIHVFETHVFDRINVLGDSASRGLPQRALDFLDEVRCQIAALDVADATLAHLPSVPDPRPVPQPRPQS